MSPWNGIWRISVAIAVPGGGAFRTGGGPRRNAVVFAVRTALYSAVLLAGYFAIPHSFWTGLTHLNASVCASLLKVTGTDVHVHKAIVSSGGYSIRIIDQCLAVDMLLLMVSFIAAFPVSVRYKLAGLLSGGAALFVFNSLRIIAVFLIGKNNPRFFDIAHIYFGQSCLVIMLAVFCVVWIGYSTGSRIVRVRSRFFLTLILHTSVLFIVWMYIQKPYIGFMDSVLCRVLPFFFGQPVSFPARNLHEYSFNFVVFTALMLSGTFFPAFRKALLLSFGLVILAAFQFIFRILASFSSGFGSAAAYDGSIGIFMYSGYLLPLILWICARYWFSGNPPCPFCGKFKKGIIDHIRFSHGEDALASEQGKRLMAVLDKRTKGAFID